MILGVVDHVVMPYKLPVATNRDVINHDNVNSMILSLVIISSVSTTTGVDQSEQTLVTDDRNIALA